MRLHMDVHWMIESSPLREVFAVSRKDLHAVVFAIAHQQVPVRQHVDSVRRRELAGLRAEAAPALFQLPFRRETMDHGVPVAVGNVDVAVEADGHIRWMAERRLETRPLRLAQRESHMSLRRIADDLVRVAINE